MVNEILPLIQAAIAKGVVKPTGCEDAEELAAEAVAMAAEGLESAERRGKTVPANSVAFYAVQRLKYGRRSGYAGKADVMSAAAMLCGRVRMRSMDESMGVDEDSGDELTLHDILAGSGEDVESAAARELDWDTALQTMDDRMRAVVQGTAEGIGTGELAARYSISAPRVCQVRESAGEKILGAWGGDPINDATRETAWGRHVRSYAERRACRAERAAEWKAR